MIITISTLVSMSEHLLGAGIILDTFQTLSCLIPVTALRNVYCPGFTHAILKSPLHHRLMGVGPGTRPYQE